MNTDNAHKREKPSAIQVEIPRATHVMASGLYNSVDKLVFQTNNDACEENDREEVPVHERNGCGAPSGRLSTNCQRSA